MTKARLFLLIGCWFVFLAGAARAEDYFGVGSKGPKPPADLLSAYARFVEAARTSQFLLRTGSSAICFAKLESEGWRIYRYSDKPIE